jgi:hypothetical protein
MVIGLDAGAITRFIAPLIDREDGLASLRPALAEFAERHQIPV